MKKIAFILSLFIFFSYSTVFSFNSSESYEDMVTVIIETYENNLYVYNDIYDKIKALSPSVSPIRYTYTSLFYGFSINTNGSYIIRLTYDLESTVNYFSEHRFSDTIPADVTIFSNNGEKYWYCDFLNIECALDIDWLMSFGIEPYVHE